jgi:mono/diheme cytochrome c family protein
VCSGVVALAVFGLAGVLALAWHPEIEAVPPPAPSSFDPSVVRRGEQLASIGSCASCHTVAGAPAYAGGYPVKTPFGVVFASNITPEPTTGIGKWSKEAFRRALREGVSRDGHLLYPAFPYNHFTHLADEDIDALYAFLMTRPPAYWRLPPPDLIPPLQFRPLVAGWDLLFLDPGPIAQQPPRGAEWNRGAYLVQSAAHCGACHTPRNVAGAERKDAAFAGGFIEGWQAPALDRRSPSPIPWTVDALQQYLRTGLVDDHAIAVGPMQREVQSLSHVDDSDLRAIATYIHSQMQPVSPDHRRREAGARQMAAQPSLASIQARAAATSQEEQATLDLGARVYAAACSSCHDKGRDLPSQHSLHLSLAFVLYMPGPQDLIRIIRHGIAPPSGYPQHEMPPFAGKLSDGQLTALVTWLRHQATNEPPWHDVEKAVRKSSAEQRWPE